MNPFRRLGRQVEQFKSKAEEAAEEHADHRCAECEARFSGPRDRCPKCDSENVVPLDREETS